MKVFLIRHAQSEENALDFRQTVTAQVYNEIIQRSHSVRLTALGEQQAEQVAELMARERIEKLYSSPFTRARLTAEYISTRTGLEPHIIEDLREVMPRLASSSRKQATLGRHFIRSYLAMLLPVGENTWAEGYRRVKGAWEELVAEPYDEIAAVAHSATFRLILLSLRNSPRWQVINRDTSNGGVSVVVSRGTAPRAS